LSASGSPQTRQIITPEHLEALRCRQALTAALDLLTAELLVCRDPDEYLHLKTHRDQLEKMRRQLEEESEP
jgi:hypothetical protein